MKLAPWGSAAFLPLEKPLGAAAAIELLYDAETGAFSGLGPAVVAARGAPAGRGTGCVRVWLLE